MSKLAACKWTRRAPTIAAAAFLLMSHLSAGAAPRMIETGDQQITFKSSEDGSEQPYRLYVPRSAPEGGALPLVVVLHGHGVDHNAWFDLTPVKTHAEGHGFVAAAPFGRGNFWYRGLAEQDVLDIVNDVRAKLNIDDNRIYLIGHSMGGWGTAWVGLRHPDVFAAIAPMSGWAPQDLLPNAEHLAPLLLHDETDPIVPVTNTRTTAARLAGLGISHQYREETGYGHGSSMIGNNFPMIFEWLESHPRVSCPRHVMLSARTAKAGSAWWVRLLETKIFPDTANIDAAAASDGTINVTTENVARFALNLQQLPPNKTTARTLVVDGTGIPIPEGPAWLMLDWQTEEWSAVSAEAIPNYESKPITISWELPDPKDERAWNDAWVRILMEECGGEMGFFVYTPFHHQGSPWTMDRLIDTYCYAEETLARAKVKGARIQEIAATNKDYFLVGGTFETLDPEREYDVLAPANLALRLTETIERLPGRVDQILVRAWQKKSGAAPGN